jgi:predicted small lipoprotein YifL
MRSILFALLLVGSLSACGKKKPAASPASAPAAESSDKDGDMKDSKSSDDEDDNAAPDTKSADPQEGGQ